MTHIAHCTYTLFTHSHIMYSTMIIPLWSSPYERVFWWQIWKVFRPSLHMVTNITIWMLDLKGGYFHFQIKMVTDLNYFQMVTWSNGDKFDLKWKVKFISNGDMIKWWHFVFDKNKWIYFRWWHNQMVTYLVWNEIKNNNRFFIPLSVWIFSFLRFFFINCYLIAIYNWLWSK